MAGGYLKIAQRVGRTVAAAEPLSPSAPCPRCGCAIGWQAASGVITCGTCWPKPSGQVTKMILLDLERGPAWVTYNAATATAEEEEMAYGEEDPWESAVEIIPCASCGALKCWWDGWDRRRCMDCDAPVKATRLLKDRDRILAQEQLRPKRHKGRT